MLTLLRVSTGESWHMILAGISRKYEIDYECVSSPTYLDYKNNNKEAIGCGNKPYAIIYFISFIFTVSLIFLKFVYCYYLVRL